MPVLVSRSLTVKRRGDWDLDCVRCAGGVLEVLGFGDLNLRFEDIRLSGFLQLWKCLDMFNLMTKNRAFSILAYVIYSG